MIILKKKDIIYNDKDFIVIDIILKYALDSWIAHHMYNICKITYCTGKWLTKTPYLFSRKGFTEGDLSVALIGNKITLTVGKKASALTFDLYECKAAEKKTELQDILFKLATSSEKLEEDLAAANKTVEHLKSQTAGGGTGNASLQFGSKRDSHAKPKPKKVGMSVVNPTSKKRKAATGVVFDWCHGGLDI